MLKIKDKLADQLEDEDREVTFARMDRKPAEVSALIFLLSDTERNGDSSLRDDDSKFGSSMSIT